MYRKIRCDEESWKLFKFRGELNKALVLASLPLFVAGCFECRACKHVLPSSQNKSVFQEITLTKYILKSINIYSI